MSPTHHSSSLSSAEISQLSSQLIENDQPLRIFGYGSIIWQPNFPYASRTVGWIAGYKRRFYQGSEQHRGTQQHPGRVATILPSSRPDAATCGVAFEIRGSEAISAALAHLTEREVRLGGYGFHRVSFQAFEPRPDATRLEAFVYIAEPDNQLYLGKRSLKQQAHQIAQATGPAGTNADYVKGIADFMLAEVPDGPARDPHVFELLRLVEACQLQRGSLSSLLSVSSGFGDEQNEIDDLEDLMGDNGNRVAASLRRFSLPISRKLTGFFV